jgi:hypothetical protein
MSSSIPSCVAAIVLALIATHPAKADTYKITVVDHTQNENFLGIDDQGDFVVNDSNNSFKCGQLNGPCFEVFLFGQSSFFSTTAPVLAFDNGARCTIVLDASFAPQASAPGICNNGHEIFGAFTGTLFGVFDGPDVSDLILGATTFDGGFINANGDAVFIDGFADELIFAQDLTTAATPEPTSLLLFGTGCLSILGTLRRYTRSRA